MSETSQGPGWWLASDGKWYPPAYQTGYVLAPPQPAYTNHPYSGHYRGPMPRSTNALAIASLILSVLWLFGLGSVLAVIFALVALSTIRASHGQQAGMGLAFAGLIIGICGLIGAVGFFAILNTSASDVKQLSNRIPATKPRPVTRPAVTAPPVTTAPVTQPGVTTPPPVTLPAATTPNAVNQLGATLNVRGPPGAGLTKVLVLDVAYPVPLGVGSVAITSVGVCAGTGGSQTVASSYAFVMEFSRGPEAHTGPDSIPSLGSGACTDAELYFEIPPGSRPTYVAYGRYRWLVPAR